MSNYMDEDNAGDFRDVPEEAGGEPSPEVVIDTVSTRRQFPTAPKAAPSPQVVSVYTGPVPEIDMDEEVEEDFTEVLSDARLRLEQGRLYELVMNSDLFAGSDCDPKAIKNVEKEIRNFARERMEIMLGMRQEASKEVPMSLNNFPFNALEVEALKALASAATQGASKESEPFTSITVPRKTTLNPIVARSGSANRPQAKPVAKPLPKAPAAPVKRPKVNEAIQRILEEEGVTLDEINQVFDPNHKFLTPQELAELTPEQIVARNKQANIRVGKSVENVAKVPMPSQEHMESMYTQRAQTAAANPQMQMIMNLLEKKK